MTARCYRFTCLCGETHRTPTIPRGLDMGRLEQWVTSHRKCPRKFPRVRVVTRSAPTDLTGGFDPWD
jgi:hypothetical protein